MRFMYAALLLHLTSPAFAMNWEGKEDWLDELPQALAFEQELPRARPAPAKPCSAEPSTNPYEQVQIPGKNCVPVKPQAQPKR